MSEVKRYKMPDRVIADYMARTIRTEGETEVVAATDYDAATARANRAEADAAAYRDVLENMLNGVYREWALRASALLKQPHPGQRYLDLMQIVEGLPVLTDKAIEEVQWDIVGTITTCEDESEHEWTQPEANALARLLAWRQAKP